MDFEVDINHRHEHSDYLEKSSFMAFAVAKTNLRHIRNQFINTSKKYGSNADYEWMKVEDQLVAELILKSFADDDKKKILDATLDKSRTPIEILDICKIPSTSGYRKINSLIRDGLLIPNGTFMARSKKEVRRYISALDNIKIEICKGKLVVKVKFTKIWSDKQVFYSKWERGTSVPISISSWTSPISVILPAE